jgi:hypothetical protein
VPQRRWIVGRSVRSLREHLFVFDAPDPATYCYLLGLYLGDGTISPHPRGGSWYLRLFLDRTYPAIVAEARAAMAGVAPTAVVRRYDHKPGVAILHATSPSWPHASLSTGPARSIFGRSSSSPGRSR